MSVPPPSVTFTSSPQGTPTSQAVTVRTSLSPEASTGCAAHQP